jgi:hypothetical protein
VCKGGVQRKGKCKEGKCKQGSAKQVLLECY